MVYIYIAVAKNSKSYCAVGSEVYKIDNGQNKVDLLYSNMRMTEETSSERAYLSELAKVLDEISVSKDEQVFLYTTTDLSTRGNNELMHEVHKGNHSDLWSAVITRLYYYKNIPHFKCNSSWGNKFLSDVMRYAFLNDNSAESKFERDIV